MALNFDNLPLKELRRGRELQWDPHAIDFTKDATDWLALNDEERELILGQVFGFLIGERAVAHDLAPLQTALRVERGHMDEEMYITQQLYEESTHVEFFQRWLDETLPGTLGVEVPYPKGKPAEMLTVHLRIAMEALYEDKSPEAQMRAVVAYHQIIEGVYAEFGYEVFYAAMDPTGILPGLREGVRNIQKDESRHIAFGTYLAQRIIRDHPQTRAVFEEEMDRFLPVSYEISENFKANFKSPLPFGIDSSGFDAKIENFHRRRRESVLQGHLVEA
jgi:ribonucleoside-diphosphate reductase beta chain